MSPYHARTATDHYPVYTDSPLVGSSFRTPRSDHGQLSSTQTQADKQATPSLLDLIENADCALSTGVPRGHYTHHSLLCSGREREKLQEEYDAILIDPNARAEDHLYNAIFALRTLVAPVKPAGKGNLSLGGLGELVGNMERELDIEIGLSCVVPCGVGQTNAHKQYQKQFENTGAFDTPVTTGNRESLMDRCGKPVNRRKV